MKPTLMLFSAANELKKWLIVLTILLSFSVTNSAIAQVIAQDDPEKMINDLSNQVIYELNANRAILEKEPTQVKLFANRFVLPYIDTEKMARYVMGREWRSATDAQKKGFTQAFTNTLIRSYSQSLLKLNIESVKVDPAREEKPGRVTVASNVTQAGGNTSEVVYRLFLDKESNKWMLYDVAVEGISMLLNYRKVYASEISKKGMDQVISDMQAKNADFNA